jgi:hypothetical protein
MLDLLVLLSACGTQHALAGTWWRSQIDYLPPPPQPWTEQTAHQHDAFVGSPSLVRLPPATASHGPAVGGSGRWLASHDRFFAEKVGTTYVFGSASEQPTGWQPLATVSPMHWAQLFAHGQDVYLIGTSGDLTSSGDVVVSRCPAPCNGTHWTPSSIIFRGSPEARFHAAPTPVATSADGKSLYRAFDVHAAAAEDLQITMLTADASCEDLTLPSCWARSPGLASNSTGAVTAPGRQWEEPVAVVDHRTGVASVLVRLDVLGSAHCTLSDPTATLECANRAALLGFDPRMNTLSFQKFVRLPSGCNKFAVRQDPVDKLFYTLSNPVGQVSASSSEYKGNCIQRNELVLARASASLSDWRTCAVVAWDDLPNKTIAKSIAETGLQYVDFHFAATDIVAAVRAGYNGSVTFHDASRLLAIHVQNHRSLCGGVQLNGSGFQLGLLADGQAAFNDREYQWRRVPSEVAGLQFTRKAGSVAADIQVQIPRSASELAVAAAKGFGPTIYAGVCPQQAGHNSTLLSGAGANGWKWENTSLSFVYDSDDRVVQLFRWVPTAATRAGRQDELTSTSFVVPADKTFCGTILVFSPLLPDGDPRRRDNTQ